ncbi:MAG: c-type cytochrome [Sphingomicrobium sp.]
MAKNVRGRISDAEAQIEQEVEADRPRLIKLGGGLLLFVLGAGAAAIALLAIKPQFTGPDLYVGGPTGDGGGGSGDYVVPTLAQLPKGDEGAAIQRAIDLFNNTNVKAADFVGNGLACKNCHIDSGRKAGAAPMWAAWVKFPVYDSGDKVTTMRDRIKGCFTNSMNAQNSPSGAPPPLDHPLYGDLELYFAWLAKGATAGATMAGQGFPKIDPPALAFDPVRGKAVYAQTCAACHGNGGNGASQPNGTVVYPAIFGAHSYNWDAGMADVALAAAFIKANMPFNAPGTLTTQQAWDVSAYVNSQERPKSPLQKAQTIAQNGKANFTGFPTYYGQTIDGRELGAGSPGAGPLPRSK